MHKVAVKMHEGKPSPPVRLRKSTNICYLKVLTSPDYYCFGIFHEFHQSGGACGNFAIIQVNEAARNAVSRVRGGHSALVTATADGEHDLSLRIYTLAESDADDWLADVDRSEMGDGPVTLHGIITYDYRTIISTVRIGGR